jgi:hypothetical protein
MSYTPDATDVTNPIAGGVKAATAAAEFIAIKLYMRDVLLAGINAKAPLSGPTFSGVVRLSNGTRDAYLQVDSAGFTLLTGAGQTGNGIYAKASDDSLQLWAGAAARVYVNSVGNVGVGTNSPTSNGATYKNLDVRGTSGGGSFLYSGDSAAKARFGYGAAAGGGLLGTVVAEPLMFETDGVERARIDSSGSVRIGTSAALSGAGEKLSLSASSTGFSQFVVQNNNSGYGIGILGQNNLLFYPTVGGAQLGAITNDGVSLLIEGTTSLQLRTAGAERARIDASGNFGIGITPSAKLHVNGSVRFDGIAVATSATAGAASALPATPQGYVTINIAGTNFKVPYYQV